MKTKFYCAEAEIYEGRYSGTKQMVIERAYEAKPKNQYKQKYGVTAFKIWFTSKTAADELCEGIRAGDIGIDTLINAMRAAA